MVKEIIEYESGKNINSKDYVFKDIIFGEGGFMVFSDAKYDENTAEYKKLGKECPYKERYYYYEKLPNKHKSSIIFILFNPSKANPQGRDDTIQNCYDLVKDKDKYGYMEVLNVFSSRNPVVDKKFLLNEFDNTKNINFIREFLTSRKGCDIVLGWGYGKEKDYKNILDRLINIIDNNKLNKYYIGLNLNEALKAELEQKPRHPGNQSWSMFGGFKADESAVLKPFESKHI